MKPNIIVKSLLEPISYCLPNLSIKYKVIETSKNNKYLENKRKSKNYNNGYIKLGIGRECLNACLELDKLLMLNVPFFIIHGDQDPITDSNISREFFIKSHCADKDLLIINTDRHGLLVENDDDDIIPRNIIKIINDKINHWSLS
jgi:esterase/lipase